MFVQSIFHLLLGGGGQRLIGSMLRCFAFNIFRHLGDVSWTTFLIEFVSCLISGTVLNNLYHKIIFIEKIKIDNELCSVTLRASVHCL